MIEIISEGALKTLNANAFEECLVLDEIVINNDFYKTVDDVLYTADMSILMFYPLGKENTEFTIPESVLTIQSGAFNFMSDRIQINSRLQSVIFFAS